MDNENAIERALYITRIADLKHYSGDYSRLYFGNEFCEHLIPSIQELNKVISFALENDLAFTLVTPYVTDAGLRVIEPLLRRIEERMPGSEVAANDWGVIQLLNDSYTGLEPVMGRLLNKMKRAPRFTNLLDVLSESTMHYFKSCSLDSPLYRRFLLEKRVRRVELDNLLQGIALDFSDSGISGSLYIPYACITTTRLCLAASCDVDGSEEEIGIFPCRRECQKYVFQLTHPVMPVPLIRKGNTMFYENKTVPEDMLARNINRIVVAPEVPL